MSFIAPRCHIIVIFNFSQDCMSPFLNPTGIINVTRVLTCTWLITMSHFVVGMPLQKLSEISDPFQWRWVLQVNTYTNSSQWRSILQVNTSQVQDRTYKLNSPVKLIGHFLNFKSSSLSYCKLFLHANYKLHVCISGQFFLVFSKLQITAFFKNSDHHKMYNYHF